MGMFSSIRAAKRMAESSSYSGFDGGRPAKNPFEKILDQKKEAYPNSWKYFQNRLSKGILQASKDYKSGKIDLTSNQRQILHKVVSTYWAKDRSRLVIPGSKGMNFFQKLYEIFEDPELFKKLWGKKGSWPVIDTECELKSPVTGAIWTNGSFTQHFYIPLPTLYNRPQTAKSHKKAELIVDGGLVIPSKKVEKVLVKPIEFPENKWLIGGSYWAFLPKLNNDDKSEKKFKIVDNGAIREESVYRFWSLRRENKLPK